MKPYNLILIIALIPLTMCKHSLSNVKPVTEPLKIVEWQKIYRCCENKCYLLESMTKQTPVRKVTHKEIYDNYNEETILFSNRWCPEIIN